MEKTLTQFGSRYLRTEDGRTEVSTYFQRLVERGVWQDIRFGWSWTLGLHGTSGLLTAPVRVLDLQLRERRLRNT